MCTSRKGCSLLCCLPILSPLLSALPRLATTPGVNCLKHSMHKFESGREINTSGDSFLAAFEGPARAIRCAGAICNAVRALGLEVRCGVHTGECDIIGNDLAGI